MKPHLYSGAHLTGGLDTRPLLVFRAPGPESSRGRADRHQGSVPSLNFTPASASRFVLDTLCGRSGPSASGFPLVRQSFGCRGILPNRMASEATERAFGLLLSSWMPVGGSGFIASRCCSIHPRRTSCHRRVHSVNFRLRRQALSIPAACSKTTVFMLPTFL